MLRIQVRRVQTMTTVVLLGELHIYYSRHIPIAFHTMEDGYIGHIPENPSRLMRRDLDAIAHPSRIQMLTDKSVFEERLMSAFYRTFRLRATINVEGGQIQDISTPDPPELFDIYVDDSGNSDPDDDRIYQPPVFKCLSSE